MLVIQGQLLSRLGLEYQLRFRDVEELLLETMPYCWRCLPHSRCTHDAEEQNLEKWFPSLHHRSKTILSNAGEQPEEFLDRLQEFMQHFIQPDPALMNAVVGYAQHIEEVEGSNRAASDFFLDRVKGADIEALHNEGSKDGRKEQGKDQVIVATDFKENNTTG